MRQTSINLNPINLTSYSIRKKYRVFRRVTMCCTKTLVRMKLLVQRLVHDGLTSGHDLGALEARGIGADVVEL